MWRPELPVKTQLGPQFPGAHSWGVPNAILNKVQILGQGSQDSLYNLAPIDFPPQNLSLFLFMGALYFSQVFSV